MYGLGLGISLEEEQVTQNMLFDFREITNGLIYITGSRSSTPQLFTQHAYETWSILDKSWISCKKD
jgi:hypothetical protein